MGETIKIARSLHNELAPFLAAGRDLDEMLESLLFEIPEEAMEAFTLMADPVEVEVGSKVADLIGQIAEAFGMTPLGLTVLMHKVSARTFKVAERYEKFKADQATK